MKWRHFLMQSHKLAIRSFLRARRKENNSHGRRSKSHGKGATCGFPLISKVLPEELIEEILLQLPFKAQCRFRCVCKAWSSSLSILKFPKAYLFNPRNSTLGPDDDCKKLILSKYTPGLYCVEWELIGDGKSIIPKNLDCQLENDDSIGEVFQILGSGNGLVCIGRGKDVFLLNPFSGESMKIPREYLSRRGFDSFDGYGFGYDKAHDDYNVVAMVGDTGCFYSLRSTLWRLMEGEFMDLKVEYNIDRGVVLNGGIHWAVTFIGPGDDDEVKVIVVYDFESRRIWGIPTPDDDPIFEMQVGVLNGYLCLFYRGYGQHNEFWVMREYGVNETWMKYTLGFTYSNIKPLGIIRNGQSSLFLVDGRLAVYNFETEEYGELEVVGTPEANEFSEGYQVAGIPDGERFSGADTYIEKSVTIHANERVSGYPVSNEEH